MESKDNSENSNKIKGTIVFLLIFMIIEGSFIVFLAYKVNALSIQLNSSSNKNLAEQNQNLINIVNKINDNINNQTNSISSTNSQQISDYSLIINKAIQSTVTIKTDIALGSGFIITPNGYIVTNAHVIDSASTINVITQDQKVHDATLIGSDTKNDIALLKISGNYPNLQFANSDNIYLGQNVIALGSPLGLSSSVTEGIVSGIHRIGNNGLSDYIQTDAPLNPGNSGGPLLDTSGKVIGINNFKIGGAENIGFALESNTIINSINQIVQQSLVAVTQ